MQNPGGLDGCDDFVDPPGTRVGFGESARAIPAGIAGQGTTDETIDRSGNCRAI
jgi:hypothetical protein